MRRVSILMSVCFLAGSMLAAEPAGLPTSEDMHKLFADGQYQQVLQALARVLPLKGTVAKAYDRVDLLTLRGETFLQMKQQAKAIESFRDAIKEAQTVDPKAPRDPKVSEEQVRGVWAEMLLITKSQGFVYKPKAVGAGEPISILDVTKRKEAYTALLADVKGEMAPKVNAAKGGKSLVPVIEVVRVLGDLRAVEQSATGATTESDALLDEVAGHAAELMGDETTRLTKLELKVSDSANTSIAYRDTIGNTTTGTSLVTRYRLTGLTSADKQNLNSIVDTTAKIAGVAHDFGESGVKTAQAFKKIEKDSVTVHDKASDVLSADYTKVYDSPPRKPN